MSYFLNHGTSGRVEANIGMHVMQNQVAQTRSNTQNKTTNVCREVKPDWEKYFTQQREIHRNAFTIIKEHEKKKKEEINRGMVLLFERLKNRKILPGQ